MKRKPTSRSKKPIVLEPQFKDVIPKGMRVATRKDFLNDKGKFNCNHKKYYSWCRGNMRWWLLYTIPYEDKEDMQNQIDRLKFSVILKEILVDDEL